MKSFLRNALAILFVATSTSAFATGKLVFKSTSGDEKQKYNLGLSVYERPHKNFALKAWLGGGAETEGNKDAWAKVDLSVEAYFKALSIGFGAAHTEYPNQDVGGLTALS